MDILKKKKSKKNLRDSLVKILYDLNLRKEVFQNAMKKLKELDLSKMQKKIFDIFRSVKK